MDVTAVVVTYNSAIVIGGCLTALHAASHERDIDLNIVVVDNASTDASVDIVRRTAPDAIVVEQPTNLGYAAGVNAGARVSGAGRALLVLNADIRVQPGALSQLLDAASAPGVGIAVPRIEDPDGHLQYSLRRAPTIGRAMGEAILGGGRAGRRAALGEILTDPSAYQRPQVADWATGAAMLITPECWARTGPWDESFFLYSEETDFALRAHDVGFVLRYTPDAVVTHVGGELMTSPYLWSLRSVNRVELYRRRSSKPRAAAYRGAAILHEIVRLPIDPRGMHRAALRALVRPRVEARSR